LSESALADGFEKADFAEIAADVRRHLAALPSAVDSFLEDHILASTHYRIVADGDVAGFASIHEGRTITQFFLNEPYRQLGQQIFAQVRRLEEVGAVLVPTCDELFLAHALDNYRQMAKQAYFFSAGNAKSAPEASHFSIRLAGPDDTNLVQAESGDFFNPIEKYIERQELFVTLRESEPVGFGLRVRSALYDDVASIGMYTMELFRRQGVGTATIALLIEECRRQGLRPVAGCWYYNHRSKQTLERAGMYSPTRLLRIEY
jgi:GNAT superfamily N-acetyltransferase